MTGAQTTIAAISTPPGTGGIGIVRLSGPDALSVAGRVFRPRGSKQLAAAAGFTGLLGRVADTRGDVDDCIAFVYRAPRSYTGEDVVELSCHGGAWTLRAVLRLCLDSGAVPAAPGEFTRRAFQNGKLDLSEAEAVMDLIAAGSDAAARAALAGRDGRLSREIEAIAETLLSQAAHLAAWADYPDEDIGAVDTVALAGSLRAAAGDMERLCATWDRGRVLREGAATAIVGRPNVGKSTLMNLLAGAPRSIVTDIPGTTRDIVEDSVRLGDVILRLIDTAGLRPTQDPVERIGVERARRQLETADLVLAVFDSSHTLTDEDRALLEALGGRPCIAVINKIDLPPALDTAAVAAAVPRTVTLSAKDGTGREELEAAVAGLLGVAQFDPGAALVSSERQRQCLLEAGRHVAEALEALDRDMTLDAVNVSLDCALDALLALTGRRATDAVVDQVFARFCVGK